MDIYHAGVIVEYVFVYKNWPFLTSRNSNRRISASFYPLASFEMYVREQTQKIWENEKKFEVGQLHYPL